MDPYQTILSLRSVRHFTDQPIPDDALEHILQAGRWAGSAKNIQPWHFIVVRDWQNLQSLAACGAYASHLKGARLAVVLAAEAGWAGSFDLGRCAQNMMLAAWAEGIGSCIASLSDELRVRSILHLPETHLAQTAISFGYPQPDAPQTIEGQPRERVLAHTGRAPLAKIVHWEKWKD